VAEFDGKLAIIDIKTSSRVKTAEDIESYFMQEAAYAIMFEERTGIPVTRLVTIMTVDFHETLIFNEHRDKWTKKLLETIKEYKQRKMFGHI
jgi:genome maintenance exonuclease 1